MLFRSNFRIAELPVYQIASREDLLKLVNRISLDGVLFPNLKTIQQEKERLIRFCEQISLRTLVVPEMEEVHNGAIKRSIRDIKIEDLLGREEIQINMQEIVTQELTVRGTYIYTHKEFGEAMEFIAANDLAIDTIVSEVIPLEKAPELFDAIIADPNKYLKVVVTFD